MDIKDIINEIRNYIIKTFEIEIDGDFTGDVNLFDYGYIDSMDATRVVLFLEENFNIEITQKDIMLYPMNSINEIATVVKSKLEK